MSPAGGEAPAVAVDVAVFTVLDRGLQVLLVRLRRGVFAGRWALPGGRVHADETLEGAARRLLAAETGVRGIYLEQLYTFGHPERDPHGRVVSVAYFALIPHGGRFQGRSADGAPSGRDLERWSLAVPRPRTSSVRASVDSEPGRASSRGRRRRRGDRPVGLPPRGGRA